MNTGERPEICQISRNISGKKGLFCWKRFLEKWVGTTRNPDLPQDAGQAKVLMVAGASGATASGVA